MVTKSVAKKKRSTKNDLGLSREQRALLEQVLLRSRLRQQKEEELRVKGENLQRSLFPSQTGFIGDGRKKKLARCSRRAGKTHLAAVGLLSAAISTPGIMCPYITLCIKNARRILWNTLGEMDRGFGLDLEFRQNDLTVKLSNGSSIVLGGAQDRDEVDKWRGPKYSLCVIDEAQSMRTSILNTLIEDVLEPATLDLDGSIWMFGTPNASSSGYFYDADAFERSSWSKHNWTLLDNPHLPGAQTWLDRRKEENGWSNETPIFRREYLGEWTRDTESMVYRFSQDRNVVEEELEENFFDFVLGVDLGYEDSTAFVVLAFSEDIPEVYCVHAEKAPHMGVAEIAEKIKRLEERYRFVRSVVDTGGLGKMITEEMNKRFELNLFPAEKARKLDHITLMNSDFERGRIQIVKGPLTESYIDELDLLEWDQGQMEKGRYKEAENCENHCCDAALYAWREALHYLHREQTPKPDFGSSEYFTQLEKEMESDMIAKVQRVEEDEELEWWEVN